MKSNNRAIQCLETGIIYPSCREADRVFGWSTGTSWRIAAHGQNDSAITKKYGVHFAYVEDRSKIGFEDIDERVCSYLYNSSILKGVTPPIAGRDAEVFKQIPDFPNYEISNFGRVRHIRLQRIKSPCCGRTSWFVVIQKDKQPHTRTIRSLYNSAWNNVIATKYRSNKSTCKLVECITDEKLFFSYSECAKTYGYDYQRFREALHSTALDEFEYKGKRFKKIN